MQLKEYERPQYNVNPIFEAVCQLRFPTILRILENPIAFQEKIRKDYPDYQEFSGLPEDLPSEVQEMLKRTAFKNTAEKQHKFLSEDKVWQVSLGKNYISLTNIGEYTSFDEFNERLNKILNAFHQEYEPTSYSRVGLRYRNLIAKKVFKEIDSLSWKQLIPQHVAPELHDKDIGESKVAEFEKKTALHEDKEKVSVFHVLTIMSGEFKGVPFDNELAYVIDIDSFTEEKINDPTTVRNTIQSFKKNIQNIFRHSISDDLHKALERTPPREGKVRSKTA